MDPTECDHDDGFALGGGITDEGDTIYVGGTCKGCGASVSAVYPLTHYLVFEEDGAEPVEVGVGEREALVQFYPQVWVGDRAAPADEPTVTFLVPLADAMADGELVEDDSAESDALKDHPNAPEWVQEWSGPFYCTVSEVR